MNTDSYSAISLLDKLKYIKKAREQELSGECNLYDIPIAKRWAEELGIDFAFDPRDFDPEGALILLHSFDE
jgi:hypothetical protein